MLFAYEFALFAYEFALFANMLRVVLLIDGGSVGGKLGGRLGVRESFRGVGGYDM